MQASTCDSATKTTISSLGNAVLLDGADAAMICDSEEDHALLDSRVSAARQRESLWSKYNQGLETHPLVIKSTTACVVLGLGDLIAQAVECMRAIDACDHDIDWGRSLRYSLCGLFGAPWSHIYFFYLDYWFPPTPQEPCSKITLGKLFIDQFIQAPIMLLIMICTLGVMQFESTTEMMNDLKQKFIPSIVANWNLWIPASFINMAFVKPSLRVLFVNVVFFVWIIIFSMLLNSDAA